jgi:hypothetical protein
MRGVREFSSSKVSDKIRMDINSMVANWLKDATAVIMLNLQV